MSYYTKASWDKIQKRGLSEGGVCTKCGQPVKYIGTGRSMWFDGFCGGQGEVRAVGELYCACDKRAPIPPHYGAPIYESEVVEV